MKYILSAFIIMGFRSHYICEGAVKRCINGLEESCAIERDWIISDENRQIINPKPKIYQQKCASDESCINSDLLGGSTDKNWLSNEMQTFEKRRQEKKILKLLATILKGKSIPGKRCANLFDDYCNNGGLIGGGSDEEHLNNPSGPGRR
ncbi:hypothetical protein FQA39_LY09840 [Lamprigera yunnana]|nr:hypothetical protein FQA39_LY09840 [Lamprigera yunnana]